MSELGDIFLALMQRVQELERRTAGSQWRGTVKEVDPKKGTARLVIGQDDDGQDVLSPPIPYAQTAGALKIHSPPSVGQQMEVYSQGGDIEQATLRPLHWKNDLASPSDKGDEHVVEIGTTKVRVKGDEVFIQRGQQSVHMKADGSMALASAGAVTVTGQSITLDGPVAMPKGFTAGDGEGVGGLINGPLNTTKDITSQTRVAAPVLQGALIA